MVRRLYQIMRGPPPEPDWRSPTEVLLVPTRGGWLTIFNCAFWAAVVASGADREPPFDSFDLFIIFFSLPLALPVFGVAEGLVDGYTRLVVVCVAVGLNGLAWGYGVSALWSVAARLLRHRRSQRAPSRCVRCGYDLRATPDRCPECGTAATE